MISLMNGYLSNMIKKIQNPFYLVTILGNFVTVFPYKIKSIRHIKNKTFRKRRNQLKKMDILTLQDVEGTFLQRTSPRTFGVDAIKFIFQMLM